MLQAGPAYKVTLYFNEDTAAQTGFLKEDILFFLQENGIAGATLLRTHAGFGPHRRLHREGDGPVAGEHLPLLVVFIDREEKIRALLPKLQALITDGLIEMHPTEIIQHSFQRNTVDGR